MQHVNTHLIASNGAVNGAVNGIGRESSVLLLSGRTPRLIVANLLIPRLFDEVSAGVNALPRGGAEIGGLLVGPKDHEGGFLADEIIPIPIKYRSGPSVLLSSLDLTKIEEAIASVHKDPSKTVIGFYRSCTRGGAEFRVSDRKILTAVAQAHARFATDFHFYLVLSPPASSEMPLGLAVRNGNDWGDFRPFTCHLNPPSVTSDLGNPQPMESETAAPPKNGKAATTAKPKELSNGNGRSSAMETPTRKASTNGHKIAKASAKSETAARPKTKKTTTTVKPMVLSTAPATNTVRALYPETQPRLQVTPAAAVVDEPQPTRSFWARIFPFLSAPPKPVTVPEAAPTRSEPTQYSRFEQIYSSAPVRPAKSYGILKIAEMVNSSHLTGLSREARRCALLMALEAASVKIEDVLEDAVERQKALNEYELAQQNRIKEFEAVKQEENGRIQAELERLIAEHRSRIQVNLDEVTREQKTFRAWQREKHQEVKRIAEAATFCVPQLRLANSTTLTDVLDFASLVRK